MNSTEVKKLEPALYIYDVPSENRLKAIAEAAARAMNDLYKAYKFRELSEIPLNVEEWKIKRTLEENPELAKLAQVHHLHTLKYEVPKWIQESAQAFSKWHAVKATHLPNLHLVKQVDNGFAMDEERLNQDCEQFKRYLTNERHIRRWNWAKDSLKFLEDEGELKEPGSYRHLWASCPAFRFNTIGIGPEWVEPRIDISWVMRKGAPY